jgi:nicotinate-nucleotide pyrophosphorylase (carboxylating)
LNKIAKGELCSPKYLFIKSLLYEQFKNFFDFFTENRWKYLLNIIHLALIEDGEDLTSNGIFEEDDMASAYIIAKQNAISSSLPLIDIILFSLSTKNKVTYLVRDGEKVEKGTKIAEIKGPARDILKAERVILNFLSHTFGVSTYTNLFVQKIKGSSTKLLDTRKTIPGMRYLDKYSVLIGGGINHRIDLSEMLMIKDNHIDRAGSIKAVVKNLRDKYKKECPPIIVECRNIHEVREAVAAKVNRILLDNMTEQQIKECLKEIPSFIKVEISGGITLENICSYANLGADYISVGAITKDAPCIDLSMRIL